MATVVRDTWPQAKEMTSLVNGGRLMVGAGSDFHLDASEVTVTAPDADTAPKAHVLANNLLAVMSFHMADVLAHKAADTTSFDTALSPCTDDTTCIALVLALAEAYSDHIASTSFHYNADSTNTLSSLTVTTIGEAESVGTDMKAKLNLHMAGAPAGHAARLVAG